jgi:hypothetical protein
MSRFPHVSYTHLQGAAGQPGLEDIRYTQPGLEVADPYSGTSPWSASTEGHSAPEVVPQDFYNSQKDWQSPEVTTHSPYIPEKEFTAVRHYPQNGQYPQDGQYHQDAAGLEAVPEKRKSRRWIWIGALIAVIVVVGAVVGGVVGSQASRNSSKSATSASETSAAAASASGTATSSAPIQSATFSSIRSDSKLAVTGWRSTSQVVIDLYYQDPDDNLRYSNWVTSANWSSPRSISAGGVLGGTGMAASTIMSNTPVSLDRLELKSQTAVTNRRY